MERNLTQCLAFFGLLLLVSVSFWCEIMLRSSASNLGFALYDGAALGVFVSAGLIAVLFMVCTLIIYGKERLREETIANGTGYSFLLLTLTICTAIESLPAFAAQAIGAGMMGLFLSMLLCLCAAWSSWGARRTSNPWNKRWYWLSVLDHAITPLCAVLMTLSLPTLPFEDPRLLTLAQAAPLLGVMFLFIGQYGLAQTIDRQLAPMHNESLPNAVSTAI